MRHVRTHIISSLSSTPECHLLLLVTACKIYNYIFEYWFFEYAALSFQCHSTKLMCFTSQSVFQKQCLLIPTSLNIFKLVWLIDSKMGGVVRGFIHVSVGIPFSVVKNFQNISEILRDLWDLWNLWFFFPLTFDIFIRSKLLKCIIFSKWLSLNFYNVLSLPNNVTTDVKINTDIKIYLERRALS